MNKADTETLGYKIESDFFVYYSDWKEIKVKFQKLPKTYAKAQTELRQYLEAEEERHDLTLE